MTVKRMTAVVALIQLVLGLVMWQSCYAYNVNDRLPEHRYPAMETALTSAALNPKAGAALEQVHAMAGVPDAYDDITLQAHGFSTPLLDFVESAIRNRGGAAYRTCDGEAGPGANWCSLQAALPPDLAAELQELQTADFQETQAWLERQPTNAQWSATTDDFTLSRVNVRKARAAVWPFKGHHTQMSTAGGALFIFAIMVSVLAWLSLYIVGLHAMERR